MNINTYQPQRGDLVFLPWGGQTLHVEVTSDQHGEDRHGQRYLEARVVTPTDQLPAGQPIDVRLADFEPDTEIVTLRWSPQDHNGAEALRVNGVEVAVVMGDGWYMLHPEGEWGDEEDEEGKAAAQAAVLRFGAAKAAKAAKAS